MEIPHRRNAKGIPGVMAKIDSKRIAMDQACRVTIHAGAGQRTWGRLPQEDRVDVIPDISDHLKMSFRQSVKFGVNCKLAENLAAENRTVCAKNIKPAKEKQS